MISTHIGEFAVLFLAASFYKQSEGELLPAFCKKRIDYFNIIML